MQKVEKKKIREEGGKKRKEKKSYLRYESTMTARLKELGSISKVMESHWRVLKLLCPLLTERKREWKG